MAGRRPVPPGRGRRTGGRASRRPRRRCSRSHGGGGRAYADCGPSSLSWGRFRPWLTISTSAVTPPRPGGICASWLHSPCSIASTCWPAPISPSGWNCWLSCARPCRMTWSSCWPGRGRRWRRGRRWGWGRRGPGRGLGPGPGGRGRTGDTRGYRPGRGSQGARTGWVGWPGHDHPCRRLQGLRHSRRGPGPARRASSSGPSEWPWPASPEAPPCWWPGTCGSRGSNCPRRSPRGFAPRGWRSSTWAWAPRTCSISPPEASTPRGPCSPRPTTRPATTVSSCAWPGPGPSDGTPGWTRSRPPPRPCWTSGAPGARPL